MSPGGLWKKYRVPSSPCFGKFSAEIRSRSNELDLGRREHPRPLTEPGGLLDQKGCSHDVSGRTEAPRPPTSSGGPSGKSRVLGK
uniref:Uncharacterized protein n=1 Tax=Bursaphelenchus xylophilus TaxID=6326 RepID=A0A1I7SPG1_BURXY